MSAPLSNEEKLAAKQRPSFPPAERDCLRRLLREALPYVRNYGDADLLRRIEEELKDGC